MLTRRHFISLADIVRKHSSVFSIEALDALAEFCHGENPAFDKQKWLDYCKGNITSHGKKIVNGPAFHYDSYTLPNRCQHLALKKYIQDRPILTHPQHKWSGKLTCDDCGKIYQVENQ